MGKEKQQDIQVELLVVKHLKYFLLGGAAMVPAGTLLVVFTQGFWLVGLTAFFVFGAYFAFIIYCFFKVVVNKIEGIKAFYNSLSFGNLPDAPQAELKELQAISAAQQILINELKNIKAFFIEIGKGNLDNNIKVFNDSGELGQTLLDVKAELKNVANEDRERNWTNVGLSKLGEILRKEANLQTLCDKILSEVIHYTGANQGYLFTIGDSISEGEAYMDLRSAYAFNKKKFMEKRVYRGDGLAGQAWIEGGTIYLKEIPEDYVSITSGLGDSNPRNILIVPLKNDDEVQGVLEIASFKFFEPYQIEFIEKIAESIAVTVSSGKNTEKTQKLLDETREMAEQLRSQEEEMRQNVEELQATQEELQRSSRDIIIKETNLNALINHLDAAVVALDRFYNILALNNQMKKFFEFKDVRLDVGNNILQQLTMQDAAYYKKMFDRAMAGEKFSITDEIHNFFGKTGKSYYEMGYTPIFDQQDMVIGVCVLIKDITKDLLLHREIEHKQSLLEGLINNTEDNIMAIDRNYNVTIINDRYKERYANMGYKYDVGTNAFSVMDKAIHEEWKGYYDKALGGERFSFQKTFEDSMHTITREYFFNPIKDREGKVTGMSIFNRLLSDVPKLLVEKA